MTSKRMAYVILVSGLIYFALSIIAVSGKAAQSVPAFGASIGQVILSEPDPTVIEDDPDVEYSTCDVQCVLDVIAEGDPLVDEDGNVITYAEDDLSFHCAIDGDQVCGPDVRLDVTDNGGTLGVTATYPDGSAVTVYTDGTRTSQPPLADVQQECWDQYESGAYTADELNICLAETTIPESEES